MGHPHAGMQLKSGIRLKIYQNQYTAMIVSLKQIGHDIMISHHLNSDYLLLHDNVIECDADLVEQAFLYPNDVLLNEAVSQQNKRAQLKKQINTSRLAQL